MEWGIKAHDVIRLMREARFSAQTRGRLAIVAGRIVAARESDRGLDVQYRRRGAAAVQTANFTYAFNCTGPLHSVARSKAWPTRITPASSNGLPAI